MRSLFILSILAILVVAQPPIPNRYPGHTRGSPTGEILLEAYFDHLCPDSLAAWPVIQQVINYYGNKLNFVLHIFPLPYHRNAFYTAQAGLVVEAATNEDTWFKFLQVVFDNQDEFSTPGTQNETGTYVINQLAVLANSLGVSNSTFFDGMQYGSEYDANARINWKYATTRGIYGTPIFYVNGVWATDDSTWSFTQWRSLLDPLVSQTAKYEL